MSIKKPPVLWHEHIPPEGAIILPTHAAGLSRGYFYGVMKYDLPRQNLAKVGTDRMTGFRMASPVLNQPANFDPDPSIKYRPGFDELINQMKARGISPKLWNGKEWEEYKGS